MVVTVGDLTAVQTEVEADAPWIAKVVHLMFMIMRLELYGCTIRIAVSGRWLK